jgi:hypothetical protein
MSETDVRTPRLAVWGFACSLVGLMPWLVATAFALVLHSDLGAGSGPTPLTWGMLLSLLSIPGLVLSVRGLRLARKRQAPEGLAMAGLVLGIAGTVLLVLVIVFFASMYWTITHDPTWGE